MASLILKRFCALTYDWPRLTHVVSVSALAVSLCVLPISVSALAQATTSATGSMMSRTVLGDVIQFGDGTARSWVMLDDAGQPTKTGITLTEAALRGLPADVTPGMIWSVEYVLSIPQVVPSMPFNHIGVNWNPRGHDPGGIYNVPHFDFHFYTIAQEERRTITARGSDLETCSRPPVEGLLPDEYVFAPDSEEPGMGGHWIDPMSHEFHGRDFTSTFIYGSYDGRIIFYEPMVTVAFLESKPQFEHQLKVPRLYARTGFYPTGYSVTYDEARREYTVSLDGLTLRTAS